MTPLVPSACMALLGAFLVAIVYPLLTARRPWQRQTGSVRMRLQLVERKEQLYASIKELEFDRALGKMSQDDYEGLRAGLEVEALEVLRQLDALDGQVDAAATAARIARIEADVAALGRKGPPGPMGGTFCPGCGQPRHPAHRFCPQCGAAFSDAPSPT